MARHLNDLGTLIVTSGAAASSAFGWDSPGARAILGGNIDYQIDAPSTLTATSVKVQVTSVKSPSAGDWRDLTVGNAEVTFAGGDSVVVPVAAIRGIRVLCNANEGADRTFKLFAQVDAG